MKKWRGIDIEKVELEAALCGVGDILSKRFHDRAKELIVKISKFDGITIDHLLMGMGGWVFGRKSRMVISKDDVRDFDDYIQGGPWGAGVSDDEEYEARWPGLYKLAIELEQILMELTSNPYLCLLELKEKEMKKLLAKK